MTTTTTDSSGGSNTPAVTTPVGPHVYPRKFASRCQVCQSNWRDAIEMSLAKGYTITTIYRQLPPDARISKESLANHRERHTAINDRIQQVILSEQAKKLGMELDHAEGTMVDHIGFARIGIQKVFEDVQEGKQRFSVKDAVKLAEILAKIEEMGGGEENMNAEVMWDAFTAYMDAAKAVMSQDQLNDFGRRLSEHPTLQRLLTRQRGAIDAESSEDGDGFEEGQIVDEGTVEYRELPPPS